MLAHNDDDLPSRSLQRSDLFRLKGKRSSNPRRNLKLKEEGKREIKTPKGKRRKA
jgi:hypothetical protein